MKYPRTARIFRGQLDAAPFAGVFFLLLAFVVLASLYSPGVRIELPPAPSQVGSPDKPTLKVAVDARGQIYFENVAVAPQELRRELKARMNAATEPMALIVFADKAVTQETRMQVYGIAGEAGIQDIWEATLPRLFEAGSPAPPLRPP